MYFLEEEKLLVAQPKQYVLLLVVEANFLPWRKTRKQRKVKREKSYRILNKIAKKGVGEFFTTYGSVALVLDHTLQYCRIIYDGRHIPWVYLVEEGFITFYRCKQKDDTEKKRFWDEKKEMKAMILWLIKILAGKAFKFQSHSFAHPQFSYSFTPSAVAPRKRGSRDKGAKRTFASPMFRLRSAVLFFIQASSWEAIKLRLSTVAGHCNALQAFQLCFIMAQATFFYDFILLEPQFSSTRTLGFLRLL